MEPYFGFSLLLRSCFCTGFEVEPSASCSAEECVLITKVSKCLSFVLFLNSIDDFNSVLGHS